MGEGIPVILALFGLFAFIALGFFIYSAAVTDRRLDEYAAARGWEYERSNRELAKVFPRVAPFGIGSSRGARNVFRYRVGERTGYSFTYSYSVRNGDQETTHHHHVVSLDLREPLPRLVLRPETLFSGVAKMFGSQDVQFESEAFNRAWVVQSEHLPAAHDILHPRLMEWLTDLRGCTIVIEDQVLFVAVAGRQKLERIDSLIGLLGDFESDIPPFVWEKRYPRQQRRWGV